MRAPVNRIVPFSSVDGPGNRTAIFTQGCSFHCSYCHNPETMNDCIVCGRCVDVCPVHALSLRDGSIEYDPKRCVMCDACIRACEHHACPRIRWMTPEDALREILRNVPFIRGVTVSGGECTLQRAFLLELAESVHAKGLTILLDSNGGYDFSADPRLTEAVDGVMLDVKAWNDTLHERMTGRSAEVTRRNLSYLAGNGKLTEVRTVVVPELMAPEETVTRVAETLVALGCCDIPYKIICFRPIGVREPFRALRPPTGEELDGLVTLARERGLHRVIRI